MKTQAALSLALMLSSLACASAGAASSNYQVTVTGTPGQAQSAGISHTINAAGEFEDIYTFEGISGMSLVNGTLSTVIGSSGHDIDLLSVTLNGKEFTLRDTPFNGNPDGREQATLSQTNFTDGLILIVRGTLSLGANSTSPVGTYSASFNITQTTTPVPEPETYSLMAAGLLAVAWVARRRGRSA